MIEPNPAAAGAAAEAKRAPGETHDVLEVAFKARRREYYANPKEIPLRTGDWIIVQADRGEDLGRVHHTHEWVKQRHLPGGLRSVLRQARPEDLARLEENRAKEERAFRSCKERVEHREVEMKIVDCEFQFDGNRITFFFTAEKRVDFRDLVKDLASIFRTRIELRQIGVRDESGRIGGMGTCGRELCCATWLREFEPITLKGGIGEPRVRVALELGLGAALVLCVLPRLLRAGPVHAALGACGIVLALTAARVCPLDAIVWFALFHNLTPVGFLAERLRGAVRRRALGWCAVAFGAVPALFASGALGAALVRFGLPSSSAGPPGVGALTSHLGAFVPGSLRGGALELDLFRAAAFLQCMHYAVVLHVLPRLGGGDVGSTAPLCWPRSRWLPAATAAVSVGLTAAFGLVFADARVVYGIVAAVHAWIEIPVLVLASACVPLGVAAAAGARA
jgi:hypothetical protein